MKEFDAKEVLENAKTIAIVGLSDKEERASNRIGKYLKTVAKYQIIPVNPNVKEVFGEKSYKSLKDIPLEIDLDIVSVFRRSEHLKEIASDAVERGCKAFWAQLGIYDEEAVQILQKAEIAFTMNRCIFVEHRNNFY
ncbi:MAG: CoA-binding protein [bacterium]